MRRRSDRLGEDDARLGELQALLTFVETFAQLGEFAEAEQQLARAEQIAAEVDDPSLRAECDYRRGLLETDRGNPHKAAEHFHRAAEETVNPVHVVRALQNAGHSELGAGLLAKAARTFERLVEVAAADPLARAYGHLGLARVAIARNEYQEAAGELDEVAREQPATNSAIAVELA